MSDTVTGSPVGPLANAIFVALRADANLMALVGNRVYDAVPRADTVAFPYVTFARTSGIPSGGAMQREGTQASVWLDVWSDSQGNAEANSILSRIQAVLTRANLPVAGFTLNAGSLTCEMSEVFPDTDPDMPETSLYHGVQHWVGWLEESV